MHSNFMIFIFTQFNWMQPVSNIMKLLGKEGHIQILFTAYFSWFVINKPLILILLWLHNYHSFILLLLCFLKSIFFYQILLRMLFWWLWATPRSCLSCLERWAILETTGRKIHCKRWMLSGLWPSFPFFTRLGNVVFWGLSSR